MKITVESGQVFDLSAGKPSTGGQIRVGVFAYPMACGTGWEGRTTKVLPNGNAYEECEFTPGAELYRLEMGKYGRWETETPMGKIIAVEGTWDDLKG